MRIAKGKTSEALLPGEQVINAARDSRCRFRPWHLSRISPTEELIIFAVIGGMNNEEIAKILYVSTDTIKTQLAKLFRKFGLRYRAELVVLAYETGIVGPGWVSRQIDMRQMEIGRDHFPFQK
ncbi:helix-turn-helix transcriptional regulator [Saccharopolyspora sp. ASAGF58]|uniref:helix-turn-helix domain-containing protein n=1 Tax=Saccharopolyspora sp. ASAGF58 TaxID=2719023 RepID=UPI00144031D8|nr:helix-turn-helix transcriptional regulator [Saccharopolyspora sp. ASAGF58]QIZ37025.1 helix-turn-helix transcriptional regulator [Saccharopolyspora sp. ASAGF58]